MTLTWTKAGPGQLINAEWVDGKIRTQSSSGITLWNSDGSVAEVVNHEPQQEIEPRRLSDPRLPSIDSDPHFVELTSPRASVILSDGTLLAWFASKSKGLVRWNSGDKKPTPVSKPKGLVPSMAHYIVFGNFTDDGKVLVLFSDYCGWAEAFDVATGKKIGEAGAFGEHSWLRTYGKYAVVETQTNDGQNSSDRLQIFDAETGRRLFNLANMKGELCGESLEHGGRIYFIRNGDVHVWDLAAEKIIKKLKMPASNGDEEEAIMLSSGDGAITAELLEGGWVEIDLATHKVRRVDC